MVHLYRPVVPPPQMAKELKRVDISSIPELVKLAKEVQRTNESALLQQETDELALLSPVTPKKRSKTKAKAITSDDALFRLIGRTKAAQFLRDMQESNIVGSGNWILNSLARGK
jgi:hypothetical protein